ncbi:MAG: class II aldolase/adducin family protein [Nocardioidaceae bacterium]|nr:class II aldolase/adducin family protein [Nocardioidaceae bacterium]
MSTTTTEDATLREELALACRILDERGLTEAYGHVSARLDERTMLISPRVGPGVAASDAFVVMTLDGEHLGGGSIPIEWHIHGSVYAARPDVRAIMRTHSFEASVLSMVGEPVRTAHYLGSLAGAGARVHEVPDLITDADRGAHLAVALGEDSALLLRGNGQVVVGTSVPEACVRALYLDEAARLQRAALSTGRDLLAYTAAEVERFAPTWADQVNIDRAWGYYAR